MEEEHAEEKQMAQWCRENVEQTKDGTLKLKTPNIIGNMEDVQQPFSSGNWERNDYLVVPLYRP